MALFHSLCYVLSQWVSCCLVPCSEYAFVLKSACISSLFLSIDLMFHSLCYVHAFSVGKLLSCPICIFRVYVCVEKCMYFFFFFNIH